MAVTSLGRKSQTHKMLSQTWWSVSLWYLQQKFRYTVTLNCYIQMLPWPLNFNPNSNDHFRTIWRILSWKLKQNGCPHAKVPNHIYYLCTHCWMSIFRLFRDMLQNLTKSVHHQEIGAIHNKTGLITVWSVHSRTYLSSVTIWYLMAQILENMLATISP